MTSMQEINMLKLRIEKINNELNQKDEEALIAYREQQDLRNIICRFLDDMSKSDNQHQIDLKKITLSRDKLCQENTRLLEENTRLHEENTRLREENTRLGVKTRFGRQMRD